MAFAVAIVCGGVFATMAAKIGRVGKRLARRARNREVTGGEPRAV